MDATAKRAEEASENNHLNSCPDGHAVLINVMQQSRELMLMPQGVVKFGTNYAHCFGSTRVGDMSACTFDGKSRELCELQGLKRLEETRNVSGCTIQTTMHFGQCKQPRESLIGLVDRSSRVVNR